MSESMIERVARAMATINDHYQEFAIGDFREAYLDQARAALEAMRQPTDAMVDAGWGGVGMACVMENPADVYTLMIDTALNEQVAG